MARACCLLSLLLLLLQRDLNGKTYYEFEYTAKNNRYTRHSLAVVVANDGEAWQTGKWPAAAPDMQTVLQTHLSKHSIRACDVCH